MDGKLLYIDGKLVDLADIPPVNSAEFVTPAMAAFVADCTREEWLHHWGKCRTLPTYLCPYCVREALRAVDLADPWSGGER